MTKKHFQALAEIVKKRTNSLPKYGVYRFGELLKLRDLANELADTCQSSNPRFDRRKFLEACGVSNLECKS